MVVFIMFIIVNLFCLSEEMKEIPQFDSLEIWRDLDYYLDISLLKKPNYVYFYLSYSYVKSYDINLTLYTKLSNSLNFSNLTETEYFQGYRYDDYGTYSFHLYYNISMDDNYKYLLARFSSPDVKWGFFYHKNTKPISALHLAENSSIVIKGSEYIYLNNTFKDDYAIYFSFSFENVNNTNLTEYTIYYSLENFIDDLVFKKLSATYISYIPRIKNNRYTFYYQLSLYNRYKKDYLCLKPGNETLNNNITISHIPRLPYSFKKYTIISTSTIKFIYTDISNISIGNEIYYKITIIEGKLNLKYKLSDESFYDDYINLNPISPKNKDTESGHQVEYYNIKKENKSNFLLFETSSDNYYNFTILQTEEDEFAIFQKKKKILIIVICVGVGLLIIMIVSLIIGRKKQMEKEYQQSLLINKK